MLDAQTLAAVQADFHTHTTFSDGTAGLRDMVQAAADAGLACIGITDHSAAPFDPGYALEETQYSEYIAAVREVQREFAGRIRVLAGMEQDIFSPAPPAGLDYCIGSVHYVRVPGADAGWAMSPEHPEGGLLCVDLSPETLEAGISRWFDGDGLALAEAYFATVAQVAERTGASIVGHFDLVKKFNARGRFFNEASPRYVRAWQHAADELLKTGVAFEINTNGVRSGRCVEYYPSNEIVAYLRERGARLVHGSDAHDTAAFAWHREGRSPAC